MNFVNTGEQRPLSNSELPSSVFAERAWTGVSSKYAFVSTGDVVNALAREGIRPYLAKASHTRIESKYGYTKHLLRFRQDGSAALDGGVYPEIVVVNSHDRGSSFHVDLGLYRLICKNGLVAQYGNYAGYRGRHVALSIEGVLKGVKSVVSQFPRLTDTVHKMQASEMNQWQRERFAQQAALLRWDINHLPLDPTLLLSTRRYEDGKPTLWNVYNTIQENLLTGQRVRSYGPSQRGFRVRHQATRAVGSIDVDMKINKGLWAIASEFAGETV